MFDGLIQKNQKSKKGAVVEKGPRADNNAVLRKVMGVRFVESRELNGWSQSEAAERMGYGNSTQLSLIERGDRLPPIEVVKRASTVYGVSCDFLMGVSDEPERDPKTAEKRAAIRMVESLLETNAEIIVDTLMASAANGAPTVVTTRSLVEGFKKHASSVHRFQELNSKKFDMLPGGNTLMVSLATVESLVTNAEELLGRHDRSVLKANEAARALRERESRERAVRRAQERQRKLNELSTAPDQYHLSLADRDVVDVRPS